MANNTSAEWELSKENIQPLKKGRKVEKLAQDPRIIESERQTYEANLRFYKGSDLLKPWYDYVLWLEQTFPKGGTEGGLNTLLKKCMTEFKSNSEYNQDPRYLDVWLKYACSTSKPLDCYNFMYREKLCTECYRFYIAWAKELEESGQTKRAEMVYQSALEKEFSPEEKEVISNECLQFQTRVAKKVMDDLANTEEEKPNSSSTEEREALSRLKGRGKKQVVGSLRVGNAKLNSGPGVLVHQEVKENNAGKPNFNILEENSSDTRTYSLTSGSSNNENLPCTPSQNRENEIAPSKWTSSRIGKKSLAVPMNQISAKPKFEIHEDDDIQQPASTPCKIGGTALSTKKLEKETIVPVALFEPFDPSIKPMYCKHLIYQGVSEISFEELKAIPYLQKMNEDEVNRKIEEQKKSFENAIKLQEQQFNDKLFMLQKEISKMKEHVVHSDNKSVSSDRSGLASSDNSKENSGVRKRGNNESNSFPDGGADDTKSLLQGYEGSSKESSQLISNSPTVNTMNIMKKIWASPSNQSKAQSFDTYDAQADESKVPFQVYEEDTCTKKPTFEIFTDEEPISKPSVNESGKFENKQEDMKPTFEIFVDDQETEAAQDNRLEVRDRNNFVKPKMPIKPGLNANSTMVVTSLEDFSKKAFVSSTPAFGKRFLPDDDENTCAVPILFKKPIEPEKKQEEPEQNGMNTVNVVQDLSTIMETSRENDYKSSSSSSSSASTTNGGLLSQFSHIQSHENASSVADTGDIRKAPQFHFVSKGSNETTGYMADINSPVKTPKPPPSKKPCHKFSIQCPNDDEDDDDDDQYGGIMANYENELKNRKGPFTPKASFSELYPQNDNNSFFQQSLKASFTMDRSVKADSMFQSTCDISAPNLEISNIVGEDNFNPQADESVGELTDKLMGVMVQPTSYDISNPFNEKVQRDILRNLKMPLTTRHGFIYTEELMPKISSNKIVKIGEQFFGIKDFVGEGTYGKIFKAIIHNNERVNDTICEMNLIFKVQKPSREWEFYICSEVQKRLTNYGSFMTIPRCYSFMDGSIFASEYLPASLLDILNVTTKKMAEETFAIFFVIQLCELVHRLKDAKIIHADIKPDNIMLRKKPFLNRDAKSVNEMFSMNDDPCVQLIDFGRSIDMSLCKEGTSFTHVFKSKGACIPEMLLGKPWSYQIDYFGIASTAYCLKFGSYMNLVEKNGIHSHFGHYKRWWNVSLWKEFYHEFLNIEDASKLPDLMLWKSKFEEALFKKNVANEFNSIFKEIGALESNFF